MEGSAETETALRKVADQAHAGVWKRRRRRVFFSCGGGGGGTSTSTLDFWARERSVSEEIRAGGGRLLVFASIAQAVSQSSGALRLPSPLLLETISG